MDIRISRIEGSPAECALRVGRVGEVDSTVNLLVESGELPKNAAQGAP